MRTEYLMVMALLAATPAFGLRADVNRDGKVDFDDFFIMADEFGREGPPGQADTVIQFRTDTVFVFSPSDPIAPAGLQVTGRVKSIRISWRASTAEGLLGYNVYRSHRSDRDYLRLPGFEGTPFTTGQTTFIDSGLTEGALFYYKVTTVAPQGESRLSAFGSATVLPDEIPPGRPDEVVATNRADREILIQWRPPSRDKSGEDLTGLSAFVILRRDPNGSLLPIDTVAAGADQYLDTDVDRATAYTYVVKALDGSGNASDPSAPVTLRTPGPDAPGGLLVSAGPGSIQIRWSASRSTGLLGYNVYRSDRSDRGYERLAGVEGTPFTTGLTSYVDRSLAAGELYFYKVSAVTTEGEGPLSAFAGARTDLDRSPPAAPARLTGAPSSQDPQRLDITWEPPATDDRGQELTGLNAYRLYRAVAERGPFVLVATTTVPSYQDTDLQALTTYFYQVEALDAAGNVGPRSATVAMSIAGVPTPDHLTLSVSTPCDGDVAPTVTITWQPSPGAIVSYELQRTTVAENPSDSDYVRVGDASQRTTRLDSTVVRGQTYYYRVRAQDIDGRLSAWSPHTGIAVLP